MKTVKKSVLGFSLAEALIVLLVVSIIAAVAAPMISKRKRSLQNNAVHGKWACKYINGTLHSATASNVDAELPPDSEWEAGCKFPSVARNVKYLWVEVYGGGGGGARGFATPWVSKTYTYDLTDSAPRDGEYDVSVHVSNSGRAMSWENANNYSSTGIYYSFDKDTRETCTSNVFGEFKEEDTKYNYASCKTYKAEDVCIYTGDSTAIKTTDCINNASLAGTYCYKSYYDKPPKAYNSANDMQAACSRDGHKECEISGDAIKYTVKNKKCLNQRSLPYTYAGSASPGLTGKIYLKEGESLSVKNIKTGKYYNSGNLGGYKYSSAYDGDDYAVYHKKSSIVGGIMHLNDVLVAKMYGGEAALFTQSTSGSSRCCTTCGMLEKYLNSSKTGSTFCAKDGDDGTTTLYGGYSDLKKSSSVSKNELSILNQDFDYYHGCNGQNGSYSANLFPTSRNHEYDIKVGQGGKGASGEDDNNIKTSAKDGEETYFGWIRANGGRAAADYCKVKTKEKNDTNVFSAGTGGSGGTVLFTNGITPKRNYNLTIDQDKNPNGRWNVEDGSDGTSGIIVVSW